MSYRVRFHLAKGENFMKWQVKNVDSGNVWYYDPTQVSLNIVQGKLCSQPATAKKIHDGANKTVCAWISALDVRAVSVPHKSSFKPRLLPSDGYRISYNPRRHPHWADDDGRNLDGNTYNVIITRGRQVYTYKQDD